MSKQTVMARKYKNIEVILDGHKFDSQKEAARYVDLKRQQQAGLITDLQLQPSFELIPKQRREDGKAEQNCVYKADFKYYDVGTNRWVIEDVKSAITRKLPAYVMKRKLMLQVYGISVREV